MHTFSELHELLAATSAVKCEKLAAVISCRAGGSPAQICKHFRALRIGPSGQGDTHGSYKQLVTDVADQVHLDWATVDGHENWEALKTEIIEEHIARRLYAGAKNLPDARSAPLRPVRVLVRWSLADLLAKAPPTAACAADKYAEKLAGASFNLTSEWNSLLAGVMFIHTEVR